MMYTQMIDLIDLNENEIRILEDQMPLDDNKVDIKELDDSILTVCSDATKGQTLDLSNATFYRIYNDKSHTIEIYPSLERKQELFVDPCSDKIYTARYISNTAYLFTSENEILTDLIPFDKKYIRAFFDRLNILVPCGKVLYTVIDKKKYILKYSTVSELLTQVNTDSYHMLTYNIYDMITGLSLSEIMSVITSEFENKTIEDMKEKHGDDVDERLIYEKVKQFEKELPDVIKSNSTLYNEDDEFITDLSGKDIPIIQLQRELNNIDNNISAAINITTKDHKVTERGTTINGYRLTTNIEVYYNNEVLVKISIEDRDPCEDYGLYSSGIGIYPKLNYNIRIDPVYPNEPELNTAIRTDFQNTNNINATLTIIKNAVLAAKTSLDKKDKTLSFTEARYNKNTVMYAYANFGKIPGLVIAKGNKIYFKSCSFELETSNFINEKIIGLASILSLFSSMTKKQTEKYVVDNVNKYLYKIETGTDKKLIDGICKFIDSKYKRDRKYDEPYKIVYGKNGNVLIPYTEWFIGFDPYGKIPFANDLCSEKEPDVRMFKPDMSTSNLCLDEHILIKTFNELEIKRRYVYPFVVRFSSISHWKYNANTVEKHKTREKNLAEIIKILRSTKDMIGGYKRKTININNTREYREKVISLCAPDDNSIRYILKITNSKISDDITIELSTEEYDPRDISERLVIKDRTTKKIDDDMIDLIVSHMLTNFDLLT